MAADHQCVFVREDGSRCGVQFALNEESLCYWHDPSLEEERRAARARGGETIAARKRAAERQGLSAEDLPPLETLEDVKAWFKMIARLALTGEASGKACQEANRAVSELRDALLRDQTMRLRAAERRVDDLLNELRRGPR